MMSLVGCLLTDSELFILFPENSQILLKISVIPILLTLFHMVIKGGFRSEGRGGFSQLPKMSPEKTILGFRK